MGDRRDSPARKYRQNTDWFVKGENGNFLVISFCVLKMVSGPAGRCKEPFWIPSSSHYNYANSSFQEPDLSLSNARHLIIYDPPYIVRPKSLDNSSKDVVRFDVSQRNGRIHGKIEKLHLDPIRELRFDAIKWEEQMHATAVADGGSD